MELLTARFAQLSAQIDATTAQINALQVHLSELQEHQQQLLSVEQACISALSQTDTALMMLHHVDPSQVAVFKEAMADKFNSEVVALPASPETTPEPTPTPEPDAPMGDALESRTATVIDVDALPVPVVDVVIAPPKIVKQSPADKKLDSIFGEREKEKEQFLIIKSELSAIGAKVGTLINSRSDAKGWNITQGKDKAALYWTVGNGWEVASRTPETELIGQWEGFDLAEHLASNDIDFDEQTVLAA